MMMPSTEKNDPDSKVGLDPNTLNAVTPATFLPEDSKKKKSSAVLRSSNAILRGRCECECANNE
jgi:hypothetical protein